MQNGQESNTVRSIGNVVLGNACSKIIEQLRALCFKCFPENVCLWISLLGLEHIGAEEFVPHKIADFVQCGLIPLLVAAGYRYGGVRADEIAPTDFKGEVSFV